MQRKFFDLGRTAPCVFETIGSYKVRVEMPHQATDLILEWQYGCPVRDHAGREVLRIVLHSEYGSQVLLREACVIMDAIVNVPFSMFPVARISLIVLDFQKRAIEVVPIEEFVVWPPVYTVVTA